MRNEQLRTRRPAIYTGEPTRESHCRLEAENKELLAIADNTALILAGHDIRDLEQRLADIRDAVIGVRTYVFKHELSIGECVAWNDLKKLVGIYREPISNERYISPLRRTNNERQNHP